MRTWIFSILSLIILFPTFCTKQEKMPDTTFMEELLLKNPDSLAFILEEKINPNSLSGEDSMNYIWWLAKTHERQNRSLIKMFMVKKFMAQFQANNAYNNLWGETLYGGENTQQITVMYNQGKFVVGAGIISPFSGNYKRRTENMNTYSPYESYGYINNLSRMVMINFSCHFDFGRKAKTENKRMNNTDSDTGIIQVN